MSLSIVEKADGTIAFIGSFTNNIMDKHGDILSLSSHIDFVSRFDEGKVGPIPLRFWHIPVDIGMAQSFAVDESTGFVYVAGVFEKGYNRLAKDLAKSGIPLGMSHSVMAEDVFYNTADGAIEIYTPFEVSVLPADRAANPFTIFSIEGGTMKELSEAKKSEMAAIIGKDSLDSLMAKASERAEVAGNMGLPTKDEDGDSMADHANAVEGEAVTASEVAEATSEEAVEKDDASDGDVVSQAVAEQSATEVSIVAEIDTDDIAAVVGEIIKESFDSLLPVLQKLNERVDQIELSFKKEAERAAKAAEALRKESYRSGLKASLASVIGSDMFNSAASESDATVISKDDDLSTASPAESNGEVDTTVHGVFHDLLGIK